MSLLILNPMLSGEPSSSMSVERKMKSASVIYWTAAATASFQLPSATPCTKVWSTTMPRVHTESRIGFSSAQVNFSGRLLCGFGLGLMSHLDAGPWPAPNVTFLVTSDRR